MPDLIFTILFFFMIATHIRQSNPMLRVDSPAGTSLQKMKKDAAVIDIFIGKNLQTGGYDIQAGDAIVTLQDLPDALRKACGNISLYDGERLGASLQADKETPMYVINRVKTILREEGILKINYGGRDLREK